MSLMRDYTNPKPPLRAKGNLTYLQFIDLVKRVWAEAHPEIPLLTSGADDPAKYPCVVYSLQLRKTHPSEPKMRYREEKNNNEDVYVVGGQRFQNIVYFEAIGEAQHVDAVEHIIEIVEDFMMEFTPVFKELGVSELVYARRLADNEVQRSGANIVSRTVSYMVTTEKVIVTRYDRLQGIVVSARTWLEDLRDYYEPGTIYDNSPRYSFTGPSDTTLWYKITNSALSELSFDTMPVNIPRTNLRINDLLYLIPHPSYQTGLAGFYRVTGLVGNPYNIDVGYTLARRDGSNPDISDINFGLGFVIYIPEDISNELIDEFKNAPIDSATPDS